MALRIVRASNHSKLRGEIDAPLRDLLSDTQLLGFELLDINAGALSYRMRWKPTGQAETFSMPLDVSEGRARRLLTLSVRSLLVALDPDTAHRLPTMALLDSVGPDFGAIAEFLSLATFALPWELFERIDDGYLDFGLAPLPDTNLAPAMIRLNIKQLLQAARAEDIQKANEDLKEALLDRVAHLVLHAMSNEKAERMLQDHNRFFPEHLAGPTISVCLIVRDEASNLERCLNSVAGLAHEVIVVDTGSTDDTPAIAAQLGARVFHEPWADDFAAARNASIAQATGEWILILDADEALNPEAHNLIRAAVKAQYPEGVTPVLQLRIQNLKDTTPDIIEHFMPRLFPNTGLRFQGIIHEQICAPEGQALVHYQLDGKPCSIAHYGYTQDAMAAKGKAGRNIRLLSRAIDEDPLNPFHYFNLGLAHYANQDPAAALGALEDAWALLHGSALPDYAPACFNHMALLMLEQGQHGRVLELHDALGDYSQVKITPEYWLNLGTAYNAAGEYQAALRAFEKAASFQNNDGRVLKDLSACTWKPFAGIANTKLLQGDLVSAEYWLKKALKLSPQHPELLGAMARVRRELAAAPVVA